MHQQIPLFSFSFIQTFDFFAIDQYVELKYNL